MKQLFTLLLILFCTNSYCQDNYFTTLRYGKIELGMQVDSVNRYLDKFNEIKRKKCSEDYHMDTFLVTFQNKRIRLTFSDYVDIDTKKRDIILYNIYCEDSLTRTKSGIKLGDDKYDIIKRLEDCYLILDPVSEKGKEFSRVTLVDKQGRSMIFHFRLNVLIAIEIEDGHEDEC